MNLSYLIIYKFDQIPQLNQIDGWNLFCPSNKTHIHFIDNQKTINHQTLIIGLRELTSNESLQFRSNYQLRIFTSGCYYLDENNECKSDGLIVGSNTSHLMKFGND
ncbi:hypothetical protein I4U23_031564 [Adineta vaga]|nr:hypothetical protein I4U23_031564 [Adineta vaga]